jgi:hypothetical protein
MGGRKIQRSAVTEEAAAGSGAVPLTAGGLKPARPAVTETDQQAEFFRWVDGEIGAGKMEYVTIGAIPNGGGQVGRKTLEGYKTLGFRVGMPDIYWFLARGKYRGLFIELKSCGREASASENQLLMRKILQGNGYRVEICRGCGAAIEAIQHYGRLGRNSGEE